MAKDFEQYSDAELFYMLSSDNKQETEEAFAELYNRLSPRVFAYCRRFLNEKEDAQDVFQETFVKFFQSAEKDREMTNVPAFVLRIARNLCVNRLRSDKQTVTYEDYMVGHNDHREEKDELLDLIKRALELLPEDYREMFILREYEGFSYNEIADITEESLSTVKIRIYRAKQKIREILEPYLADLSKHL